MNTLSSTIRNMAIAKAAGRSHERRGKPVDPNSIVQRIQKLEVGEYISEVRKVDPELTLDGLLQTGPKLKQQFRSTVGSSLTLASARTNFVFETECSYMMTPGSQLYLVLIITRVE